MEVELPYNWEPRAYQLPAWTALESGVKRLALVWHRRAGKDQVALNWTVTQSAERIGVYWHLFPTQKQGRKIIWDGVTKDGKPVLGAWPAEWIVARDATEMKLKLKNGSVWQVVGSDNYNEALVGANPVGIVLSEYALQNPACWDFLRPILAENDGWAIFAYTPRGRNHGWDLFKTAQKSKEWFAQRLTVEETGAITKEAVERERQDGMPDELVQQEFYCSFEAALVGAYFGKEMAAAEQEKRICGVGYEPGAQVYTSWDLGMDDMTAIWFAQLIGREIRLIDYYENRGYGLDHYVKVLRDKPYAYAEHYLPHDVKVKELGTGKSRLEILQQLEFRNVVTGVPMEPEDAIAAIRKRLPMCWFDAVKCERGVDALRSYQREWDDEKRTFKTRPLHDWSSHPTDAFRELCVNLPDTSQKTTFRQPSNKWVI